MNDRTMASSQALPLRNGVARHWSRRQFLRTASAAGVAAPFFLARTSLLAAPRAISPNSKLAHACVGVGGMGAVDLQRFQAHQRVEIVALCDVDTHALDKAAQAVPGARLYTDWRELLDKEGGRLDSVNVAVPDHMHFSIAYNAIEQGRHVYCQKPLCHDVAEVRALTEAAVKRGVITQLGTQGASTARERIAVQWLREGRIGKVTHAYLCSNRPGAVEAYRLPGPRPATGQEPPASLKWELWLGSAPRRPYAPEIYHPAKWRAWQDFGTGWSGDIGCHIFDPVWKGLGLKAPRTVWAEVQESWKLSPERRADTWPQGDHIIWTFPGNEKIAGRELVLEWFDGDYYPPESIRKQYSEDLKEYPPESSFLAGTEGAMLIGHGAVPQLLPEDKFSGIERPRLAERDHYHHFVDACLGGEKTESHFAQSGPMTEAILLGTVAIRVPGQKLEWNSSRLKITNHREANRYLQRRYREGWRVARF
ncbi:MAG TPA: Gfo/Idh/MocA family oxidoreductase [Verrucomicrobiota bacterium]|nr:Gfo/Idh/MocA family oxidoreductase [Verrucomicrobiota bacterium]OQC26195.1 MAG: Glucose--fructose oxidoreductase precursor [Verrucomicrobia bacterium ADurb.Bin063]HRR65478.1 Gfo/Idh/MocA family oxidoreductase [Candidatus Paceibacterota bacterium]HNW06755.1 Gfo/Idh/MocA family oxidoreductase [Verrucomicrobiota bacterium]HOC50055.1 Gfo/Idh/MocA family oxidoreductase [Verrucomicrobiota bacterium]